MKQGRFGVIVGGCALMAVGALALVSCAPKQVKVSQASAPAASVAAAPAQSQTASAPAAQMETFAEAKSGTRVLRFHGVIQSVDASGDEIIVKAKDGAVRTFKIASDAKFDKGGHDRAIQFSDLKTGEHVRVIHAGEYAGDVHVMVL